LLNKITRLYHTVKYLKAKQIFWRVVDLFPRFISENKNYSTPIEIRKSNIFIPREQITSDYINFTFLNEIIFLLNYGFIIYIISNVYFKLILQQFNLNLKLN
jgi:hypothetical protein